MRLFKMCLDIMRHPAVNAAFTARMNGILDSKLEMTFNGNLAPNKDLDKLIRRHLVPQLRDIGRYLVAFGLCPVQFMGIKFDATGDEERKTRFVGQAIDDPLAAMPCVPDISTREVYIFRDELNRKAFEFVAVDGKQRFVLPYFKSLHGSGPEFDLETVDSPVGTLASSWQRMMQRYREQENSLVHAACPPIFLEPVPQAAVELETKRQLMAAEDTAAAILADAPDMPPGLNVAQFPNAPLGVQRVGVALAQIAAAVHRGRVVDPKDNVLQAPPGYKFAASPPPQLSDLVFRTEDAFLREVRCAGLYIGARC